jgi:DNA-binding transcriptional MocR family regulator
VNAELDNRVRAEIYGRFVEAGAPPAAAQVAASLKVAASEVEAAYRRLEAAHVIVLAPGTLSVWMAAPLSAVPTDFRVRTARGDFWGNCIWDGLGVVAMLGDDGTVETHCADCREPMTLRVGGGRLLETHGVAHFAVPAARWWENIGFT